MVSPDKWDALDRHHNLVTAMNRNVLHGHYGVHLANVPNHVEQGYTLDLENVSELSQVSVIVLLKYKVYFISFLHYQSKAIVILTVQ